MKKSNFIEFLILLKLTPFSCIIFMTPLLLGGNLSNIFIFIWISTVIVLWMSLLKWNHSAYLEKMDFIHDWEDIRVKLNFEFYEVFESIGEHEISLQGWFNEYFILIEVAEVRKKRYLCLTAFIDEKSLQCNSENKISLKKSLLLEDVLLILENLTNGGILCASYEKHIELLKEENISYELLSSQLLVLTEALKNRELSPCPIELLIKQPKSK